MYSWYSIEHIASRLNKKDKKRGYFCNYKGPNVQCWCDENQYSLSDECIICYLDLKLWVNIKSYPVEEVAKSYWPTPDKDDEFDGEFNPHFHGIYLLSDYNSDEDIKLVFPEIEPDNTGSRNNLELATIPWCKQPPT
ncbi:2927_t:CDS:2 [Dentiscutata erythropus]|uniref:2927_t:CDS:1 n=1 Tax=Dentiscutata erythropus TaxID=1348616 RepID=A0A9N9DAL6_9GLOM|nr:2927_t:CDS:2 [Dentiscutata erythropus]